MTSETRRKLRITRNAALFFVSLALLIYEVGWGGARPSVLALLGTLLLSPVALQIDEARRADKNKEPNNDAGHTG